MTPWRNPVLMDCRSKRTPRSRSDSQASPGGAASSRNSWFAVGLGATPHLRDIARGARRGRRRCARDSRLAPALAHHHLTCAKVGARSHAVVSSPRAYAHRGPRGCGARCSLCRARWPSTRASSPLLVSAADVRLQARAARVCSRCASLPLTARWGSGLLPCSQPVRRSRCPRAPHLGDRPPGSPRGGHVAEPNKV
jgi:hypothetical protein